ncbi:diaminopimelate epimerase [Radiobacillus kanasensis]|uniref:diaminopimelate epimerase n=1 Tax=Radiobacillus kanasensis TaxID=2844358 RepID=UPI001E2D6D66|nr:diaminopimelate epimerase [Radiobacillus kanasensis]UFU01405.1 diaminopimelate epimerase [Radiobacillus kanasensis]
MMNIPFTKMHGLGNSYIYVDLYQTTLKEDQLPAIARYISNVNTGIGSDGLILIGPSEQAEVSMRIFNKDGSEGKNCGNGLRCVAKYAYEHHLVSETTFTIETLSGNVTAHVHESGNVVEEVTVDMGIPHLRRKEIPMVGADVEQIIAEPFVVSEQELEVTAVSMGNPHAIFYVEDIEKAPLQTLGPTITKDERFPEGVNVEFVQVVSDKEVHFRVWERGSGITQACGTGACAAGVASVLNGFSEKGKEVCVHLSGGDLFITWGDDDHVWMRGKAETVATGRFQWNQKS